MFTRYNCIMLVLPRVLRGLTYSYHPTVVYSRQYLTELAVDKEQILKNQLQLKAQRKAEAIYNLQANDSNPTNYIKVRLNHPLLNIDINSVHRRKSCFIQRKKTKPLRPPKELTLTARRRFIITTLKKATLAMRPIRKLHILDAIQTCLKSHKKVAKLMARTLFNMVDHAKHKNLDINRLFVYSCCVGKTNRFGFIRYHAKGKSGREHRTLCHVTITLAEKPRTQFYESIVSGMCPPAIAKMTRIKLIKKNAGLESVRKFTGITTAKGRQQAREMMRRRVDLQARINKEKGVFVARRILIAREVRIEAKKFERDFIHLIRDKPKPSTLLERERMYRKNIMDKNN